MSSTYFGDYNNGSKMRFPSDGAIQFKNNAGSMSLKVDFASQITVNGSKSGSYTWSMPFQGNVYKKFVIYFNALNDSGKTITYPTAFTKTPYIYGVVAATAIMSTNNIALTLAPSSDVTGFAFVEGY
jgi:hypothetical protein